MIFAEFMALVAILGGGGIGLSFLVSWAKRADARAFRLDRRREEQSNDLRDALASRDYRQLEDWLVLYGSDVADDVKKHVKERRDELYNEKNP